VQKRKCRICGSDGVRAIGTVEYIVGFRWEVFECAGCKCRFTRHDRGVYEQLHRTGAISYYSEYKRFVAACADLFGRGDLVGLRGLVATRSKYRAVVDAVQSVPHEARLLEVGCSRGYLTSYFILAGRDVLGIDASEDAVNEARERFGDHFAVVGDPRIERGGPYDFIYHVGLIGCVGSPADLTRYLLRLLRPGGTLFFNAPNRDALALRGQLWLDAAPPPDVVSLFPRGFWKRSFSDVAVVREDVELLSKEAAFRVALRRACGLRWAVPRSQVMGGGETNGSVWTQDFGAVWRFFERACLKLARATGLVRCAPARPTDFGLFVTMERK